MKDDAAPRMPAFQFYPGDWLRDPAVRACSLEERGAWIDILSHMHAGEPRGHLTIGGQAPTDAELARMIGATPAAVRRIVASLERKGVLSRTEAGVIYSRRMVRDEHIRQVRAEAGRKGGNPILLLKQEDKQADKQSAKQNPTPSVAVAVAVAPTATTGANKPRRMPDEPWLEPAAAIWRNVGHAEKSTLRATVGKVVGFVGEASALKALQKFVEWRARLVADGSLRGRRAPGLEAFLATYGDYVPARQAATGTCMRGEVRISALIGRSRQVTRTGRHVSPG